MLVKQIQVQAVYTYLQKEEKQIRVRLENSNPADEIVGWYHSHPQSSAFFSETDRKEQSTWPASYNVGLVISGLEDTEPFAVFCGPFSNRLITTLGRYEIFDKVFLGFDEEIDIEEPQIPPFAPASKQEKPYSETNKVDQKEEENIPADSIRPSSKERPLEVLSQWIDAWHNFGGSNREAQNLYNKTSRRPFFLKSKLIILASALFLAALLTINLVKKNPIQETLGDHAQTEEDGPSASPCTIIPLNLSNEADSKHDDTDIQISTMLGSQKILKFVCQDKENNIYVSHNILESSPNLDSKIKVIPAIMRQQ